MSTQPRVMVFIDGSNLFQSSKAFAPGIQYSIQKLVEILVQDRNLVRPYYFASETVPPNPLQTKFYEGLRYDGIDVTVKPLKIRSSKKKCVQGFTEECLLNYHVEKGVDVSLVCRMLSFAFKNAYDIAILVSGDEDFQMAVEEVRNLGKRVEICSYKGSLAPALRKVADRFIALDDIIRKASK